MMNMLLYNNVGIDSPNIVLFYRYLKISTVDRMVEFRENLTDVSLLIALII